MMKKFTFLLVFLFLGTLGYSQTFNFYFDSDTIQNNTTVGQHIDFKGNVINLTGSPEQSRWDISNTTFPDASWQFYVCDDNACYNTGVASRVQTVPANDTSLVKVTIIAGTSGVGSLLTTVTEVGSGLSQSYILTLDATTSTHDLASVVTFSQNAPNPFQNYTIVKYDLKGNEGRIVVTDVAGRQVSEYALNAPEGQVQIGDDLDSGLYFYSLMVDGRVVTTKRLQKL